MANNRKRDVLYIKPGTLQARLLQRKKNLSDEGILSLQGNYRTRYWLTTSLMLLCGCLFALAACWVMLAGFQYYYIPDLIIGSIILLEALVMFSMGIRALKIRRRIASLSKAGEIGGRFGVDAITIQNIAAKQGVQPRCIVNGENLYDSADFGDVSTLLRASEPPVEPEALLRPAAQTQTPQEQLLRASDTHGE